MSNLVKKRQSLHQQLQENEERIHCLEEQIQLTQKMATLGTMASLAAHEFNNILVPMINYSELALQHPDDHSLMRKALEKTVEHGHRASVIIQSMLGLVRDRGQEKTDVKLADIVQECFQCIARDLKKDNITARVDIPADIMICVVPGQWLQMLLNIIINARHAMLTSGGQLTIGAGVEPEGTVITHISDSGSGIDPALIDKIFEPFVTTKAKTDKLEQKGTGLGLMVCRDIVESHGGTIRVESTLHQGTTFTISLPKSTASPRR